jgi:hypothetical protein
MGVLVAGFRDELRVDEHLRLFRLVLLGEVHGDDAPRLADLDRREPDAGRVVHGVEHVLDELPVAASILADRLGESRSRLSGKMRMSRTAMSRPLAAI